MSDILVTPLHQEHLNLDAKMVDFAGFHMPISYTSIKEEHQAVRTDVGMFDVSHMGEILIDGIDAEKFVSYIFTNDVYSMVDGQVSYGMMLYEQATIVDDLLVYKLSNQSYLLVVNASNIEKDYQHILRLSKSFDVHIKNQSEQYAEIAIQGPKVQQTLNDVFNLDVSDIAFFHFRFVNIEDKRFLISRTGYTGEDGFELYGSPKSIIHVWKKLIDFGVTPCGLGSRDTLRFEANLPLYGHEISQEITPAEAGLKYFVKLKTDHPFLGREALENHIEHGLKRRVVGLELSQKSIPREGYKVYHKDQEIGYITTGYLSLSTKKPIALALINRPFTKKGTEVMVQIRNKMIPGFIRDKKFLKDRVD